MLFATWVGAKLRGLTRRRHFRKAACGGILFVSFIARILSTSVDANFYRPITMQRANLPPAYPMTARRFLKKNTVCWDAQEYQRRLVEQGNPEAVSVQYPRLAICTLSRYGHRSEYCAAITVDGLNWPALRSVPELATFAGAKHRLHPSYEFGEYH